MSALPKPSPEPTKAQMLAAMLSGPTETASMQMTRQFLFRLPGTRGRPGRSNGRAV